MEGLGPAAGRRAKKRKRNNAQIRHAGSKDAPAGAQGRGVQVGRGAKKRKGNERIVHAEPADSGARPHGSGHLIGSGAKMRKGNEGLEHAVPANAGGQAQGSAGLRTGDLGVGPGAAEVFPLLKLPGDMQRLVLGYVPLREFACLACLSKHFRTAYEGRVSTRDTAVAGLLESHFPAEFRAGLTPAQTALPYDLIVNPPVRGGPLAHYAYAFARSAFGRGVC
jgi:hypothetical protein